MINFDSKICHLTFTHTDCADIWPAYFGETKKYLHVNMRHFVCLNRETELLPGDVVPIFYDEKNAYPRRLLSCLERLSDYEFIFFDHEDMFLYGPPDEAALIEYYNVMKQGKFDHIRLIKGGRHFYWPVIGVRNLYRIFNFSSWIFSIQPSFWKRTALIEILKANLDCNIWELEVRSQKVVKQLGLRFAYAHSKGAKRGIHHFDSDIYPFIATAIGKGKWNYSEYPNELGKVFSTYGIDKNRRGYT